MGMRKRKMKKIVSILFYAIAVLVPMLPLFLMDGEHYTLYQGYLHVKESGISGVSGAALIVISAILYSQLARHESVYLLVMCFVGVFLLVRYGGAICLRKEKEKKTYLSSSTAR